MDKQILEPRLTVGIAGGGQNSFTLLDAFDVVREQLRAMDFKWEILKPGEDRTSTWQSDQCEYDTLREAVDTVFPNWRAIGISLAQAALLAFDAGLIESTQMPGDTAKFATVDDLRSRRINVFAKEGATFTHLVYVVSLSVDPGPENKLFEDLYLIESRGESNNPNVTSVFWQWDEEPPAALLNRLNCSSEVLLRYLVAEITGHEPTEDDYE